MLVREGGYPGNVMCGYCIAITDETAHPGGEARTSSSVVRMTRPSCRSCSICFLDKVMCLMCGAMCIIFGVMCIICGVTCVMLDIACTGRVLFVAGPEPPPPTCGNALAEVRVVVVMVVVIVVMVVRVVRMVRA